MIDALTGDGEGDAVHLAVLGGFDDSGAAVADLQVEISGDRVADGGTVGHRVLLSAADVAVGPGDNAAAHLASGGCDLHGIRRGFLGGDSQLVAADAEAHAGDIGRKAEAGQYAVGIRQGGRILFAVPFQFHILRLACASGHEAGHHGMALHPGHDAVVIIADLLIEGMTGTDEGLHRVIASGADVVEVCVTLADDGLPHQDLRGVGVGNAVCIRRILGAPRGGKIPLIAILHDTAQQHLDVIRLDGAVQAAGVVVPEVLAEAGEGLAHAAGDAGLNAVDHLTVEAVHAVDGGCGGLGGGPAVHIGFGAVAPDVLGIDLVGVSVPRESDGVGF